MQDYPGAPGTARQGRTGTSVPTDSGGVATQPRAPSHERPLAAQRAAGHGWLSAALEAPGDDVPLTTTAGAPGHHRLSAVLIATVPLPAGVSRLRQVILPRVPANPRTLTYSQSHRLNRHSRFPPRHSRRLNRHSRESGNPRPPVATGGPPGGYAPATCVAYSQTPTYRPSHHTTHQVHPAVQVPPRPRSCSTAATGLAHHHPSRAPPAPCPSSRQMQESMSPCTAGVP